MWGSAQRQIPMQINVVGTVMFLIALLIVLGGRGQPASYRAAEPTDSCLIPASSSGRPLLAPGELP